MKAKENRKNIIFFISLVLILFTADVIAQSEKNFDIIYSKELSTSQNSFNAQDNLGLKEKLSKIVSQKEYVLQIQGGHSVFQIKRHLDSESQNEALVKLSNSFGGTSGVFYLNRFEESCINQKEFAGENFKVKMDIKDWQITNKVKTINGYKCYLAKTTDVINNSKGEFKFPVTAWFCPELPNFFGPAGYFGLPGLILELDNSKIELKMTNIIVRKKVDLKDITKMNKGFLVSQKEFDSIVTKIALNRFKSFSLKN